MKLNNWCVVRAQISPYLAPESAPQRLLGDVTGHPSVSDSNITTSPMRGKRTIDLGLGEKVVGVVTESGSVYQLGDVLPDYEAHYPGALARLINSLPEV